MDRVEVPRAEERLASAVVSVPDVPSRGTEAGWRMVRGAAVDSRTCQIRCPSPKPENAHQARLDKLVHIGKIGAEVTASRCQPHTI